MASLATGSVNFPNIIYENSASFVESLAAQMKEHGVSPEIEVFDLSHIYGARKLADLGLIKDRPHVQFVMGIKNALPAEARAVGSRAAEAQVPDCSTRYPSCCHLPPSSRSHAPTATTSRTIEKDSIQ